MAKDEVHEGIKRRKEGEEVGPEAEMAMEEVRVRQRTEEGEVVKVTMDEDVTKHEEDK